MNKLTITDERTSSFRDFYGIFFEDINHAADGGLYAELIRNRSFEFSPIDNPAYSGLTAWTEHQPDGTAVSLSISNKEPMHKENPHYLVMDVISHGTAAGVKNEGFNSGIPIYEKKKYKFNMCARSDTLSTITVSLISALGTVYDSIRFELNKQWNEYSGELTAKCNDFSAKLLLSMTETGKAQFSFVSLFPSETYKNRDNGLRCDIAEMLEALKPKFVRFPGGCLVHDGSLNKDERDANYRWKNTIGDVKKRPSRRNNWRYNQNLGLGYYEYFLFCEDIGAEPLPVLPAGYNPHSRQGVPIDEMGEWVDDALDLIEFANGNENTKWGHIRCELGHKEPFGLKYIAIGNEEVGQGFFDRYDIIHNAIRKKYPDIKIINSAGPFNHGGEYDRGWANAEKNGSDIIDEHYYMSPEWLIANHHRYDSFCDKKTKVFLGEYASWDNTYYNAVAEASYMIGLENNAHAVELVCYAPLLCNAQYVNWEPDMIWFDNHRVYGSANYYVQLMFMNNLPTKLLRVKKDGFDQKLVIGSDKIEGKLKLISDRCGVKFSNIKITDCQSGKITEFEDRTFDDTAEYELCDIHSEKYTVEFDALRLHGELGFKLSFGETDTKHKTIWSIGGWQNQDCIIDKYEKNASCLTQSRFSVETGINYSLKLEICGREIKTYINGKLMNSVTDIQQINEELYYTAGIDEVNKDIIIKAVNINERSTIGLIDIPFIKRIDCHVSELSGYSKDDRNSFEESKKIYPSEFKIHSDSSSFEYEFKPLSVTIFRISIQK